MIDKTYGHAAYGCGLYCGFSTPRFAPLSYGSPPGANYIEILDSTGFSLTTSGARQDAAIAIIVACGGSSSIGRASDCGSRSQPIHFSRKTQVNTRLSESCRQKLVARVRVILSRLVLSLSDRLGRVWARFSKGSSPAQLNLSTNLSGSLKIEYDTGVREYGFIPTIAADRECYAPFM